MFWKFEPYLYYHFISYCATPQYGGIIPYMNWRRIFEIQKTPVRTPPAFLPKPLLRAGQKPRQGESIPPDKLFRPASSALVFRVLRKMGSDFFKQTPPNLICRRSCLGVSPLGVGFRPE